MLCFFLYFFIDMGGGPLKLGCETANEMMYAQIDAPCVHPVVSYPRFGNRACNSADLKSLVNQLPGKANVISNKQLVFYLPTRMNYNAGQLAHFAGQH